MLRRKKNVFSLLQNHFHVNEGVSWKEKKQIEATNGRILAFPNFKETSTKQWTWNRHENIPNLFYRNVNLDFTPEKLLQLNLKN